MIVHNVCIGSGDAPEYSRARLEVGEEDVEALSSEGELDYGDDDDKEEEDDMSVDTDLLRAGRAFRERCIDKICPR